MSRIRRPLIVTSSILTLTSIMCVANAQAVQDIVQTPQAIVADEGDANAESTTATGPEASIDEVAWIAGQWQGEALGGQFEETWNPPLAGSMVGMFKLTSGDDVRFYEIMTIVPQGKSLVLRLKHFGSDLVGWEEKEKSVEFPLVSVDHQKAQFDGLTFHRISENELQIVVQVNNGGRTGELKFECRRAGDASQSVAEDSAARAIRQVYDIDRVIAKQRDELPKQQTLAIAVRAYVLGLDSIDYSDCPPEVTAAWRKHRNAWNDSITFFEAHDKLHGEMHDLFNQLRKADKPVAEELERHNTAIMDTWKLVERQAQKYGVE